MVWERLALKRCRLAYDQFCLQAGGRCRFAGLLPTPGAAVLVRELGADAAVSVSASHNPWQDNGIKIFSASGEKLPPEEEAEIEQHLNRHGDYAMRGYRRPS